MVEVHEPVKASCQELRNRRLSFSAIPTTVPTTTATLPPSTVALVAAASDETRISRHNHKNSENDVVGIQKIDKPLLVAACCCDEDNVLVVNHDKNNGSATTNNVDDTKKAQTFRRRRLSLTTQRTASPEVDIEEEIDEVVADEYKSEQQQLQSRTGSNDDVAVVATASGASDEDHAGTIGISVVPPRTVEHNPSMTAEAVTAPSSSSLYPLLPTSPPCIKRRRLSSASISSRRSSSASTNSAYSTASTTASLLKTVVVHAGELLSQQQPPPSPALLVHNNNRLYDYGPMARRQQQEEQFEQWRQQQQQQQQFLFTTSMTTTSQCEDYYDDTTANNNNQAKRKQRSPNRPRWQKRILRQHDDDEGVLPFPRDAVGTFSCHGVEPIYDNHHHHDLNNVAAMSSNSVSTTMATTIAKINQDRGGIAFPYAKCPKTALFAVYDGHGKGGELVSQFCLHEVQRRLAKHPDFMTNVEKAFRETFLAIDAALLREPLVEAVFAGSTACVALLRGSTLFVSNVGDSRAVLARRRSQDRVLSPGNNKNDRNKRDNVSGTNSGDESSCNGSLNSSGSVDEPCEWEAIDLTVDQNPNLPQEQRRIEAAGGFVSPPPEPGLSARVWLDAGCTQIGLAMSRSMGDHAVKSIGVIAEPVVSRHELSSCDEFFILASDGVWEFITSDEAVQVVANHLDRGATKACQALIEAAAAKWHDEEGDYRDDITAMVIRIPDLWTHHPTHQQVQQQQQQQQGQEPQHQQEPETAK